MGQQPEQAWNQEDLDSNGGIQAETAATAAEKATSKSSDPTSDSLKQAGVEVMTSFKSRIESWSEPEVNQLLAFTQTSNPTGPQMNAEMDRKEKSKAAPSSA